MAQKEKQDEQEAAFLQGAEFLTAKEVSKLLSCSVSSVRKWSQNGDLPAPRVLGTRGAGKRATGAGTSGHAYRWDRAEVLAFLRAEPRSTDLAGQGE